MANILGKIFSVGAEKLVGALGDAFDKNFTNKEERMKAEAEMQRIVTEHIREMEKLSNEQFKTEVEDRSSARIRETEFVKATGHIDWMHTIVGLLVMFSFILMTYLLFTVELPQKSEHITINLVGILEGAVITVVSYYFGSSAGSRLKDMKK